MQIYDQSPVHAAWEPGNIHSANRQATKSTLQVFPATLRADIKVGQQYRYMNAVAANANGSSPRRRLPRMLPLKYQETEVGGLATC